MRIAIVRLYSFFKDVPVSIGKPITQRGREKWLKKMPIRAALTRLRGAGKEHKTKTNLYADIVPTFR